MSSPDRLDFYDGELRAHHEHLRAAYGISAGDEVVDIGCGTELTTREALWPFAAAGVRTRLLSGREGRSGVTSRRPERSAAAA